MATERNLPPSLFAVPEVPPRDGDQRCDNRPLNRPSVTGTGRGAQASGILQRRRSAAAHKLRERLERIEKLNKTET
jgi:hypothetical protein